MPKSDYEFFDEPEKVPDTLSEMFDDVMKNHEKFFIVYNRDKKPVAAIVNADELVYMRRLLGR